MHLAECFAIMRLDKLIFAVAIVAVDGTSFARKTAESPCVSVADASKHLGSNQCVSGTVLRIEHGLKGATFLTFCKEAKACPFTVVVFPTDIKKMGDIEQLEGRQVEIKGTIQDHGGRAEIILRHTSQLGEGAFLVIPRVPTDYDVERRGRYSPGKFSQPKSKKKKARKQGDPMSVEDPEEPQ
jgi:hypothetical protein